MAVNERNVRCLAGQIDQTTLCYYTRLHKRCVPGTLFPLPLSAWVYTGVDEIPDYKQSYYYIYTCRFLQNGVQPVHVHGIRVRFSLQFFFFVYESVFIYVDLL